MRLIVGRVIIGKSSTKTNYAYDKNHSKGNQLGYYWDTNILQWIKSVRQIDDFVPGTAYAKDFLIQHYFSFIPGWVNSLEQQSEVNADGLFTSGITKVWDNTIPGWVKNSEESNRNIIPMVPYALFAAIVGMREQIPGLTAQEYLTRTMVVLLNRLLLPGMKKAIKVLLQTLERMLLICLSVTQLLPAIVQIR